VPIKCPQKDTLLITFMDIGAVNVGITTYSDVTPCSLVDEPTLRNAPSPFCSTLKLETTFYLKMLVSLYQATRRHSPEDHNISPNTYADVLLWTSETRLAQRVPTACETGGRKTTVVGPEATVTHELTLFVIAAAATVQQ